MPPHGRLSAIQTISTLPPDFHGSNTGAEIQIHPSGKFLYGSNWGHDSIAMFAIDEPSGKLSPLGYRIDPGKTPRHFGIDPSGKLSCWPPIMDGDNVVLFRIGADGHLCGRLVGERSRAGLCADDLPAARVGWSTYLSAVAQ